MGQRSTHLVDRAQRAPGTNQRPADNGQTFAAIVGTTEAEAQATSANSLKMTHHCGIAGETNRHVVGTLMHPNARLCGFVARKVDVPVEMVGRKVEPRRGFGAKHRGPTQPKAGALNHEGVEGRVVDGLNERNVGVAHCRSIEAGGDEHVGGEQRCGGLAIGAGDRQHWARTATALLFPFVGKVDLCTQRLTQCQCRKDHRMRFGNTRGRCNEVAAGN